MNNKPMTPREDVETLITGADLLYTGMCPRCQKNAVSSHLCFDRGKCEFAVEWIESNAAMLRVLLAERDAALAVITKYRDALQSCGCKECAATIKETPDA